MPTIYGSVGEDLIQGTVENDIILGLDGNDIVDAMQGDDFAAGNIGDDVVDGNEGNDVVRGGQGNDLVKGGSGDDVGFGELGNDTLIGDTGNDTLVGGCSEDGRSDSTGRDYIWGNGGNDVINGNESEDTISAGADNDIVHGGSGDDLIAGDLGEDIIFGDRGNDTILGGQNDPAIALNDGNDQLYGRSGDDIILGNAGNDLIFGNEGNDTCSGGQGGDVVSGGAGNDVLAGDRGDDRLAGDLGADYITTGEGSDTVVIGFRSAGVSTGGFAVTDADYITDFTKGQDIIELIGGLTFSQLRFIDGVNELAGHTIIQEAINGQYLAILRGVSSVNLSVSDFRVVSTPTPPTSGGGGGGGSFPTPTPTPTPTPNPTPTPTPTPNPTPTPTPTPSNSTPADIVLSNSSIAENAATDTLIGTLSTIDPDLGDTHTYTLLDNAGGRFVVENNQVKVANGSLLDFETTPKHNITIQVQDSAGNTFTKTLTISLNDVNETNAGSAPTDITLSATTVNENSANGTVIGDFSAVDADAGDTHTFVLIDNAGGRFVIENNQLKVANGSLLDFETAATQNIKVRVTDAAGNTFDKDFTISLNDINEASFINPPTDISLTTTSVNENSANGVVVGVLSATDPDVGDSQTFTLLDNAEGRFTIAGNQLQVANGSLLNFEANSSHNVTVQVTDAAGNTFNKSFTISVNNVNEAPIGNAITNQTATQDTPFSFQLPANSFTDPDSNALTYTASLQNGNPLPSWLTFDAATRTFSGTPTNADVGNVLISVQVTDGLGGTATQGFTVAVGNVNDAPILTNIAKTGNEDADITFTVADFTAGYSDLDNDPLSKIKVSSLPANGILKLSGNAITANQEIAAADLANITFTPDPNYNGVINFNWNAFDGTAYAANDATVSITVAPVNDAPTDITISATSVPENSPTGTVIGDLTTVDIDTGDTHTYELVNPLLADRFKIVGNQLQVNDGSLIDYESLGPNYNYTVAIRSTDTGGASVVKDFTINVTDVPDPAIANDDTVTVTNPVFLRSGVTIDTTTQVLNNDSANGGTTPTVTAVSSTDGTAVLSGTNIIFRPNIGLTAPALINYTISNNNGTDAATITVNLTVASQINLSAITAQTNLPTGASGFAINGESGSFSAISVSDAGDVNGDGLGDVIVGATRAGGDDGRSYIVFGKTDGTAVSLGDIVSGNGGFAINGKPTFDYSGNSVSSAGDVNGDGRADLIVGASRADVVGSDEGQSYIVFGKTDGATVSLADIAGGTANGFVLNGEGTNDRSGNSVSNAGDVNGDGLDDLIVGGREAAGNNAGRAYVVYGKTTNSAIDLSALGTAGFAINSESDFNLTGASVSSAGDVNGDGFADVIVGAPAAQNNVGRSYVVFGGSTNNSVNLTNVTAGNGGFTINGELSVGRSGYSVSGVGDVNGDGFADVIVGSPGSSGTGTGKSYLVFGKSTGTAINLADISAGTGGFVINGETGVFNSGISVSSAGDMNGDGLNDLIVGADFANSPSYTGRSYVVFGKTTSTAVNLSEVAQGIGGFAINREADYDRAGFSVSAGGDVNGDGFADVIVGAYKAYSSAGRSYVIFGGNFSASVTQEGTTAADVLTAVVNSEGLVGGQGNDTLSDGNFTDVLLYGGSGDDVITITNASFRKIDGGLGNDTLNAGGLNLDLTSATIRTKIAGVETINLAGGGNNTLTLDFASLESLVSGITPKTLNVIGDVGDTVVANLAGLGFTSSAGVGVTNYTRGNLILSVENEVTQSITMV